MVPTTFTINLAAGAFSDCVVVGRIVYGNGAQSVPHTFVGTSSFTFPAHNYTPGTHIAHFVIDEPRCMFVSLPITAPCNKQNCCPAITTSAEYGDCDSDGRATVILTTTVSLAAVCQPVRVRMDFNDSGPLGGFQTFAAPGGAFIEHRTYAAGQHTVYVLVDSPQGCVATPFNFEVICPDPDCCPILEPSVTLGACDSDGLVPATLKVDYVVPDGCAPADVVVIYGNGGQGAVHTLSGNGTFTEPPHLYAPGNHTAEVKVITPPGCESEELAIHAQCPPPPCCPKISTAVSYGPCDASGIADVTITTTVTPAADPNCPVPEVQYDFGGGHLGQLHTGAGTFQETLPYAGGPHVAMLNILSPPGCGKMPVNIKVKCPDCCPDVTITPCIRDCVDGPERTVEFEISVTPKPAPCPAKPITFRMDFGDGNTGQQVTIPMGGGSYSYKESNTYTGQHAKQGTTATLNVLAPSECAGSYGEAEIPSCCKKTRARWCKNLFTAMSWTLTMAVLFLLFYLGSSTPPGCTVACLPFIIPVFVQYSFYVFGIAGLAMLSLYLIFCTKCACGWLLRLGWRVLSGAGLLYAIWAKCAYQWVSVLIGALLVILAYLLLRAWKKKCCVSDCRFRGEIVLWIDVTVLVFVGLLLGININSSGIGATSGCLFSLFSFVIFGITIDISLYTVVLAVMAVYTANFFKDCLKL
ncbi:MAG: hypothetical protein E6G92_09995 [Alphaproteobacteria bacterium]|nr:MAG: hypothetical protein E6G92_09995 [Alphaproteobacteria bacterium]